MSDLTLVMSAKCHGGVQKIFSHTSAELKCKMNFSVYLPYETDLTDKKYPVLYWLSGLTCTEKNFIEKSGFQRHAAKHKIIVVGPDTSPRGCNIEGEAVDWDFGVGAGFYCDATTDDYKTNYRMYSYVTKELPALIEKEFPTNGKASIFGHSMGGHGAITISLKNPGKYVSVSAFSPVSNPSEGPWGQKALKGYLGNCPEKWGEYDSTLLAKAYDGPQIEILVDQGSGDQYLKENLLVPNFIAVCNGTKINLIYHERQGYDHSFYYVSTFLGEHFDYHAKHLAS